MSNQDSAHTEAIVTPNRKRPAEGNSITEAGRATAQELRVRVRDAVDAGKTRLTEWKGGFEEGVRERPIQSVLIAAAVGAAIGMLIGRRSR